MPYHAVARLLRNFFRISELDREAARSALRTQLAAADPDDLLLLADLLGIRDPTVATPNISADARRRRLTALVTTAASARETPGLYIVEDAHWIDEASESMLADFRPLLPEPGRWS